MEKDAEFLKELIVGAEWFHEDKIRQCKSLRIVWEIDSLSRANMRFLKGFELAEVFEDDGFFHFNITEVALDKMGLLALVKEKLELV